MERYAAPERKVSEVRGTENISPEAKHTWCIAGQLMSGKLDLIERETSLSTIIANLA